MIRKNAFALIVTAILAIVMALPGIYPASDGWTAGKADSAAAVDPASVSVPASQGEIMATGVSGGGNGGG